jgi:hypothetical protein
MDCGDGLDPSRPDAINNTAFSERGLIRLAPNGDRDFREALTFCPAERPICSRVAFVGGSKFRKAAVD